MTAPLPRDWRDDALCREVDPVLFFPGRGGSPADAKQVCALCGVRAACLDDALAYPVWQDQHGVRGGLSERQRRRLRKAS